MADRKMVDPQGHPGLVDESEVAQARQHGYTEVPEPLGIGQRAGQVIGPALGNAALAAAAVGGGAYALSKVPAIAMDIAGHLPIVGPAARAAQAARILMRGGPAEATATVSAAPVKLPATFTRVSAADLERHPEILKNYSEGDPISLRTLEDIKTGRFQATGSAARRAGKGPAIPKLTVVEAGNPATALSPTEEQADLSKVPIWRGGKMSEAGTRHDIGYFSKSEAKTIPIEDMSQPRLRAAWEKHGRELASNARLSPVKEKEFERMTEEIKHRVTSEGSPVTVYDRPEAGSAAGRARRVAQAMADVSAAEGTSAARTGAREMLGPAGNLALMILGSAHTKEDVDNAARIVQKVREARMTPTMRRAVRGSEGT